ncbi:hypothetical protein HAX54_052697, partial [Datura stramonium]|nr:hypothetical protein [Datura stramonium]
MSSLRGWLRDLERVPCVETIKIVDMMCHREGKKDAMLLVMMKQMQLSTNYIKGFHARYNQPTMAMSVLINQRWNNVRLVYMSSQESNELVLPHMEITLEVVLEKVLPAEEGVQDLRNKLLDLTTTMKSHD